MTQETAGPVARESSCEACAPGSRLILGERAIRLGHWERRRSSPGPPSTGAGWSPSASLRSFSRFFRAPQCAPCTFARAKAPMAVARVSVRGRLVARRNMGPAY